MPMKKKRKKKRQLISIMEYAALSGVVSLATLLPIGALKRLSDLFGDIFYVLDRNRRKVALSNLRHAFKNEKSDAQIRMIARNCCR